MGALISLAPMSITKLLGMKMDCNDKITFSGADGQEISGLGTSFVYLRDEKSPSWRHVKVVVMQSGDIFLLSSMDLKNLEFLSPEFTENGLVLKYSLGLTETQVLEAET